MTSEIKTVYYHGSDCNGSSGNANRTLTINNTGLTSSDGFLIALDRSFLALTDDYTVSHLSSGTIITFLNNVWNDQSIIVNYIQVKEGALIAADDLVADNEVTYSNLVSKPRENIILLITATNVPDPISSSTEFRKWIYSRVPDTKSIDFKGYPFIVVHPAEFDPNERGSLDGKSRFVSWEIEIEIFASDRGYGSIDGKGLAHIDAISDDILKTLLDMTIRNALSGNNLKFSRPRPTSVTTEVLDDELIYRRSIIATFENRLQVSA